MPFGASHKIIRKIAKYTMEGFFSEILVVGEEHVPEDGPLIVCCTHWNMIPAILSCFFPHNRMLHYWAKSTIFINGPVSALLKDAGNIPVDRKTKDNQKLFSGTFEVLKLGECVAIFPEGTSYTQPHLQAIKEGASWTAMEYGKNLRAVDRSSKAKEAKVIVASIVYTQKTNYRSRCVMEFKEPVNTTPFVDEFMSEDPAVQKQAVKRLTQTIRDQMVDLTVNAPDWDTLRAAETARGLLWSDEDRIPLREFRQVSQTLVNLFSPESGDASQAVSARKALIAYEESLRKNHFTNSSLNALPLPRILDPMHAAPAPDRLRTLWALIRRTASSLVFLPFFILPLLAHLPVYIVGKVSQMYLSKPDEPEEFAQTKIVFSLLVLLFVIYPLIFFFTWAFFLFTPWGLLIALAWTVAFAHYHTRLVDLNYTRFKKLVAAWRILVALWVPGLQGGVREMLKLRSEAAKDLAELLLQIEKTGSSRAQNAAVISSDDSAHNPMAFDASTVDWLRSLGAKIGRYGTGEETDLSGRLKQQ